MSSSLTPLNLSAATLTVLQNRSAAALSSVKSALDSERKLTEMIEQASEKLAQHAASALPL